MAAGNPETDGVRRISADIADGRYVDWPLWEGSGAVPREMLAALKSFEAIRNVHVAVVAAPRADAPTPLAAGYEVFEEIGRGRFGRVHRARDRALGREVALKTLDGSASLPPTARDAFLREARILASLDHPNIVRVLSVDADGEGGAIRIGLERIVGRTLETLVRENGPLSAAEAAAVGIDLARALAALHEKGLVHRDVKPANVMRAERGRVVLLDFGVARSIAEDRAGEPDGTLAGTPLVMAPEQLSIRGEGGGGGGTVGPRTDVFSLGVLLYWLVSDQYPYEARSLADLRARQLEGKAIPLADRRPDVPPAFATIVERATRANPDERFASAGALESALRAFAAGATVSERPRSLRGRGIGLAAAALVLGAAAVAIATRGFFAFDSESIEFEARLFARRNGADVRLLEGDAVRPGDRLHLETSASRPLFVYVFDGDSRGEMFTLFPIPGLDAVNPLPSGRTHELPGRLDGTPQNWAVSSEGGTEVLIVLASTEPIPSAEALLEGLPAARPGYPIRPGKVDPDRAVGLLRGIGALASEEPLVTSGTASDGAEAILRRFLDLKRPPRREADDGVIFRLIRLANAGE